jgi:23S rRNA (uridine2552-2'-O)-methyltransferase
MQEHVSDAYVRRARREGYRSRAAYKLLEIARADRLIPPGTTVVDLGAAPGGWSQVAAQLAGPRGKVVAVDVLEMEPLRSVVVVQGDLGDAGTVELVANALQGRPVDLVLSDMAPNISGISVSDQARAMALAELALTFSVKWLKPDGNLLVKTFQGTGFPQLREMMSSHFRQVATRKPDASRSRSSEVYLLCRGLIRRA